MPGQYYEQDSFFPQRRSRVEEEGFGSINFGAQDDYGGGSLDSWRQQASQAEPRRDPMSGFMDSLRGAYGRTPALDEYRSYLKTSPQAADYKPNWLERIASGLAGASVGYRDPAKGVETAMGMNRSKYDNALKNYYAQAGPLKEAAGIERESQQDRYKAVIDAQKSRQDYMDYVRNLNKDDQDYLIATGKLKVDQGQLKLNEDKFGYDKTSGDRDYKLDVFKANSLNQYRGGQLGLGRYNAETNRRDTDSLIGRRADQTFFDNMGLNKTDTVSASDVYRAEKDALGSMAKDYPPHTIEYDADADQWQIGRGVDPNTRATIQAEVEKRVSARTQGRLSGGGGGPMNFGGTYNPNPPSLPNFGPSQNNRRGGTGRYGGGRE